jgi:hypothetical protein
MLTTGSFDRLLRRHGPPADRRRSPRRPAVANWASLAWRDGGRMCIAPARLLDVSGAGALLVAAESPGRGHPVWIRLEEPAATAWVKAGVARRAGALKLGVEFLEHCPGEFLGAVIPGVRRTAAAPPGPADAPAR